MIETLRNAWKIPELRKKLMFTALVLLLYRIGNVIPVPFIDAAALTSYFDTVLGDTILGLYNAEDGTVAQIAVSKGATVDTGALLAVIA